MLLIPAIDLKNGECVRLRQGDMNQVTVFEEDPLVAAKKWVDLGCKRLHLVDLDGAFEGKPVNLAAIKRICEAYPDLDIQVGGGIRSVEIAQMYIDTGVDYLIIGTAAIRNPQLVKDLCVLFPNKIIVGIDAKNGYVAVDGWESVSSISAIATAKQFEQDGVSAIIYTDIARDGMMQGLNLEATHELAHSITIPVIASGGVTDIEDIKRLNALKGSGVIGTIIGRALYEGTLDFNDAQQYILKNI